MIFKYGKKELDHLRKCDPCFAAVIEKVGLIKREVRQHPFEALVMSIISQQISKEAAASVCGRLVEKISPFSAENIACADAADIQKCGMSLKKAGYIKGLAQAVVSGQIDFGEFGTMSDADIIEKLSALNGIGVWTAQMFLIFSLCRPDVVSWGDLAIRRGLMNIYGLESITKKQFDEYRKNYSPYGSVASLYIWAMS